MTRIQRKRLYSFLGDVYDSIVLKDERGYMPKKITVICKNIFYLLDIDENE